VIEFLRKKGAREEAANNFVTRICGEETRPTWELYAGLVTLLLLPSNLMQLPAGLDKVQGTLQEWDQSSFGSVRKELAKLRLELERIRGQSVGIGTHRALRGASWPKSLNFFLVRKLWRSSTLVLIG
jgi:hypothetical protein